MELDGRLLSYGAWAFFSLLAWGVVFIDSLRDYQYVRKRPERRQQSAGKELVSDFALFLVAVASALSLSVFIIGQDIPGARGFFVAVDLGGFLGAGIVRATATRRRKRT